MSTIERLHGISPTQLEPPLKNYPKFLDQVVCLIRGGEDPTAGKIRKVFNRMLGCLAALSITVFTLGIGAIYLRRAWSFLKHNENASSAGETASNNRSPDPTRAGFSITSDQQQADPSTPNASGSDEEIASVLKQLSTELGKDISAESLPFRFFDTPADLIIKPSGLDPRTYTEYSTKLEKYCLIYSLYVDQALVFFIGSILSSLPRAEGLTQEKDRKLYEIYAKLAGLYKQDIKSTCDQKLATFETYERTNASDALKREGAFVGSITAYTLSKVSAIAQAIQQLGG